MKIVNCTAHQITVLSSNGVEQNQSKQFIADPSQIEVIATIEPSGFLPRVNMSDALVGYLENIPLHEVKYGEIENLPKPQEDTFYIVSGLVASAALKIGRNDILAPGGLVRDKNNLGVVLGCLFLQKQ